MRIVAANTTHAPAGLKVTDLLGIYKGTITTWNQIPGNAGGSTATIHPFLPPSDSAINKALINDLTVANGGSFTLAPSVVTVEQNDPIPITRTIPTRSRRSHSDASTCGTPRAGTSRTRTPPSPAARPSAPA